MRKSIVVTVIIIILIILGIYFIVKNSTATPSPGAYSTSTSPTSTSPLPQDTSSQSYHNTTYDYSFVYPKEYSIREKNQEVVDLGKPSASGFEPYIRFEAISEGKNTKFKSYDDFVSKTILSFCDSSTSSTTVSCSVVKETKSVLTKSNATGTEYTLTLREKNKNSSASTTRDFGPIYVFNIGANTPSAKYAALTIFTPLYAFESDILDTLVASLVIDKVQTGTTTNTQNSGSGY